MNKKFKKIIEGIFILGIIMPSLLNFIQIISFWGIYLSITHPILHQYQSSWEFLTGLLFASIGTALLQIYIIIKCLHKVFPTKEERL